MSKEEILTILKEKSLDLAKHYNYNCIKIEMNCNPKHNSVKITVQEYDL